MHTAGAGTLESPRSPPKAFASIAPGDGGCDSPARAEPPSFEELTRCTWGTLVTVCGEPAKFQQAGLIEGHEVIVVLAAANPKLSGRCTHMEAACEGETIYYFDHAHTSVGIGTPDGAPLLREQAAACLRSGDTLQVNGCPCIFLEARQQANEVWLVLRCDPSNAGPGGSGATFVHDRKWGDAWRVAFKPGLRVHLVSTRLPTFNDLGKLRRGTPVTLGAAAEPAKLQRTQLREGTKEFVFVEARPWLNLHQADSKLIVGSTNWLYRIRFQEAGLRLADF